MTINKPRETCPTCRGDRGRRSAGDQWWQCATCKGKGYILPRVERYGHRRTDNDLIDAHDIDMAVRAHYGKPPWVYLPRLRQAPAWDSRTEIDGYAIRWGSTASFAAFEYKVTLADFRNDIDTGKWETWFERSTHFYYVTPAGLVNRGDVPPDCGLIEVSASKRHRAGVMLTMVKGAVRRPLPMIPAPLVQVIAKRAALLEGYRA